MEIHCSMPFHAACHQRPPSDHLVAAAFPQFEFPVTWPRFFQDLVGVLVLGEGMVDMFCRIMPAVDEDLVTLDIPRYELSVNRVQQSSSRCLGMEAGLVAGVLSSSRSCSFW